MGTTEAVAVSTQTQAYITHMQGAADAAIARLNDTAASWAFSTLTAVNALTLTPPTYYTGTKPALGTISLDALVSTAMGADSTLTIAAMGAIAAFTPTDFSAITAPTLPTAPDLSSYTTAKWSETFWSDLKTRLTEFTANITNADDVDTLVTKLTSETGKLQVALYAADLERRQQVLRDLHSAADSNTGAKGFTYPNCMTQALKMVAQQTFQFEMSQTSRDLVKYIFEWAKSNYQFSIDKQIAAHSVDVEFNVRYADTLLKSYATTLNGVLEKYQQDVALAISKAEVHIKEYSLQVDTTIRQYLANADEAVKAYIAQTDNTVKRYSAQNDVNIKGYTAKADELIKSTALLKEIQQKDQQLDVDIVKTNAALAEEFIRLQIQDYSERVKSFIETAQANMKVLDDNVKNKISSASAAITGAASMASAAQQIAVGIVNG